MLTVKKLETLYIAKNNPKSSEPQGEWLVQALCFASDRLVQVLLSSSSTLSVRRNK